jgi:hypothetical protein
MDDFYSNPSISRFTVTVEDPFGSKYTSVGKGTNSSMKRIEITQASIKIKEVTRDGRILLKIISDKYSELIVEKIGLK